MGVKQNIKKLMLLSVVVAVVFRPGGGKPKQSFAVRAQSFGYVTEEHKVVTEDGYVLKLFRMRKNSCLTNMVGPPVMLLHGLFLSSDSWLDAGPEAGLGHLLANACFDIWMVNNRGNHYSREHISLNPDDVEYWQWSADEMGKYDVPASIDYVLDYTGFSQLNVMGYSQGATTIFIMCSEIPTYCNKIRLFVGLGPAARIKYLESVYFRSLLASSLYLEKFPSFMNMHEFFPKGGPFQSFVEYFCPISVLTANICTRALSLLDTYHEGSIDYETVKVMYSNFPAGTSTRNIARLGQAFRYGQFMKYDFGRQKNLQVYGVERPPLYNLTDVTAPVVLVRGDKDALVVEKDLNWLKEKLPKVLESVKIDDQEFNHIDFMYSRFVGEVVFSKVMKYLSQYSV